MTGTSEGSETNNGNNKMMEYELVYSLPDLSVGIDMSIAMDVKM